MNFISRFIDASKVAGWVRAIVAAGLAVALARWPVLKPYLPTEVQTALSVVIAGILVGVWSQMTKTDDANLKAVEEMPAVQKIVVSPVAPQDSAAVVAALSPDRPKVVVNP